MSYSKTIKLEVSERATVEVETEFDITPGMPTRRYDVDPGFAAEIDSLNYDVSEVTFRSGSTIDFTWISQRGFLPIVSNLIDLDTLVERLGNLDDYLNPEWED